MSSILKFTQNNNNNNKSPFEGEKGTDGALSDKTLRQWCSCRFLPFCSKKNYGVFRKTIYILTKTARFVFVFVINTVCWPPIVAVPSYQPQPEAHAALPLGLLDLGIYRLDLLRLWAQKQNKTKHTYISS